MSRRKVSSRAAIPLKDFHGGQIPSDLPLPSAPGVAVERTAAFDRLPFRSSPSGPGRGANFGLGGASTDFSRQGMTSGGRGSSDIGSKSGYFSIPDSIGRKYEEDERGKPADIGEAHPRPRSGDRPKSAGYVDKHELSYEDENPRPRSGGRGSSEVWSAQGSAAGKVIEEEYDSSRRQVQPSRGSGYSGGESRSTGSQAWRPNFLATSGHGQEVVGISESMKVQQVDVQTDQESRYRDRLGGKEGDYEQRTAQDGDFRSHRDVEQEKEGVRSELVSPWRENPYDPRTSSRNNVGEKLGGRDSGRHSMESSLVYQKDGMRGGQVPHRSELVDSRPVSELRDQAWPTRDKIDSGRRDDGWRDDVGRTDDRRDDGRRNDERWDDRRRNSGRWDDGRGIEQSNNEMFERDGMRDSDSRPAASSGHDVGQSDYDEKPIRSALISGEVSTSWKSPTSSLLARFGTSEVNAPDVSGSGKWKIDSGNGRFSSSAVAPFLSDSRGSAVDSPKSALWSGSPSSTELNYGTGNAGVGRRPAGSLSVDSSADYGGNPSTPSRVVDSSSEAVERPKLKLLPRSQPPPTSPEPHEGRISRSHFEAIEDPETVMGDAGQAVGVREGETVERPSERPRLKLMPRSTPVEKLQDDTEKNRPSVFGGARPREVILKGRGVDEAVIKGVDDPRPTSSLPPSVAPSPSDQPRPVPPEKKTERSTSSWVTARPPDRQLDREDSWRRGANSPGPVSSLVNPLASSPSGSLGGSVRFSNPPSALELAQSFSRSTSLSGGFSSVHKSSIASGNGIGTSRSLGGGGSVGIRSALISPAGSAQGDSHGYFPSRDSSNIRR